MMGEHAAGNDVYRIPAMKGLFRASMRELPDAVPPVAPSAPPLLQDGAEPPERRYGWVAGSLPSPDPEGRYIVEFVEKRAVRVLAYLDRYGRVFATDSPLDSHPAREPDLKFARYADQPDPQVLQGCVEMRNADGEWREVARFRRSGERYTLYDSWFDFGKNAADLIYPDALTRSYLAFAYRPGLGAPEVPARGFEGIEAPLDASPTAPALLKIFGDIMRAQCDPALRPPALVRALARWLDQAGVDRLALEPSGSLRLVKTIRYADLFYLASTEEGAGLPPRLLWNLQGALNRYLLIKRALGERASTASIADVLKWDSYLVERFAAGCVEVAAPTGLSAAAGEWELRRVISDAVERLAAPLRLEVEFRADAKAGIVGFKTVVPDESMMPLQRWDDETGAVVDTTVMERTAQARRYAEHLAIYLAATAFGACDRVMRVEFDAHTLLDEKSISLGDVLAAAGESKPEDDGEDGAARLAQLIPSADLFVSFQRETFLAELSAVAKGDPITLLEMRDAHAAKGAFAKKEASAVDADGFFDAGAMSRDARDDGRIEDDPFRSLSILPSARLRRDMPEYLDAELPEQVQDALGAHCLHDLRIDADAPHRCQAERLARRLASVATATEAVQVIRRCQLRTDDPFVDQACMRLMTALAEGDADPADQNTVIRGYLGTDDCRDALQRARTLVQMGDVDGAGRLLSDAAWKEEAERRYIDDAEVVHRNFDNYSSRVLYNLIREGKHLPFNDSAIPSPESQLDLSVGDAGAQRMTMAQASLSSSMRSAARGFGEADRDRRVELVSDSLLHCHLEASKLLERSFGGIDAALAHATRAVELAPVSMPPRCLLARMYMLMGDMASASETLKAALEIATQPNEIAIAYYQLAYTLWKSGDARTGAACYVKSVSVSPIMAAQVAAELQDLLNQEGVKLPARSDLDETFAAADVPLAPTGAVLDALFEAAQRAVDAGVFPVGRSLLATYLNYRPDDALMGVYRSLLDLLV